MLGEKEKDNYGSGQSVLLFHSITNCPEAGGLKKNSCYKTIRDLGTGCQESRKSLRSSWF